MNFHDRSSDRQIYELRKAKTDIRIKRQKDKQRDIETNTDRDTNIKTDELSWYET